jgi:hypothetical protein
VTEEGYSPLTGCIWIPASINDEGWIISCAFMVWPRDESAVSTVA